MAPERKAFMEVRRKVMSLEIGADPL